MWRTYILLSLALRSLLYGAKAELDTLSSGNEDIDSSKEPKFRYIMTVSTMLQGGKAGHVCIFIDCQESVHLQVTLELKDQRNVSIFNNPIDSKFFGCKEFLVPAVDHHEAYVTFSAVGETVKKTERNEVKVARAPEACIDQMEKTAYRPGDTVRCRLYCLNSDLKPIKQKYSTVYLEEPTGARVAQIVDLPSDHGVVSVEFRLSEYAALGSYKLVFEDKFYPLSTYFSVGRHELPRIFSKVTCPMRITVLEKSAQIKISSQYSNGKPLPGTVAAKCCKSTGYGPIEDRNLEDTCVNFTGQLESGNFTKILNMDAFKMQVSDNGHKIQCEFTVKEAGTGLVDTRSCKIFLTSTPAYLQLDGAYNSFYKHGLDYVFSVILSDERGQPMVNEVIVIEVDGEEFKRVTTDAQGRAKCRIDTTPYCKPSITIRASYPKEDQLYVIDKSLWHSPRSDSCVHPGYPFTEAIAYRYFSESDSFLQMKEIREILPCYETYSLEVEYKVTEAGVGKGAKSTTFYYLVNARDAIVFHGQRKVDLTDSWKGSFKIDLYITSDYAPNAYVIVFAPMQTEIIFADMSLMVDYCFKNKVSLTFKEPVVEPGSEVHQELTAAPGSFCALRAYYAHLHLLLYTSNTEAMNVYNALRYNMFRYGGRPDLAAPCEDPNIEVLCNGRKYQPVSSPTDGDISNILQYFKLMVSSNLRVRKPNICAMKNVETRRMPCGTERIGNDPDDSFGSTNIFPAAGIHMGGPRRPDRSTLLKYFNETFAWQTVIIGSDGKGTATSTAPGTFNEWSSDMFCISETEGVGVTHQTANLTTFSPFVLELSVPPYCTRGEKVIVDVSATNHLDRCTKVQLNIATSDGCLLNPLSGDGDICLCKGQRASKQWRLDATSMGDINITASASATSISDSCDGPIDSNKILRKDTVTKVLRVQAGGIQREVTISHLKIVKDSTIGNEVTIERPDNLVIDSYELHLTVVGDTMGLTAENLHNLLTLPDGSCEQSLAQMPPIVYIVNYLNDTGCLDGEVYEKAKNHLAAGYARHLACRRRGGQYSVFRDWDTLNSWMDMSTFYTFSLIKDIIFVDESIQGETLSLLRRNMNWRTGCVSPIGSFFTIPDQKTNDLWFTAFMVIRLSQTSGQFIIDEVDINAELLGNGLKCLRDADLSSLNTYTLAHVFHAAAVHHLPIWDSLYITVKERAITKDGNVHWECENLPPRNRNDSRPPVPHPAEVDITANIMLGMLKGSKVSQDIHFIAQIATWLSLCLNSRGGYTSSQDTAVATEAMTKFSRLIYVKDPDAQVVVSRGDDEAARISVKKDNKMSVQRQILSDKFGPFNISTSGIGNILVQL
ncbi:alpha-2-macroglobulin-like protein 1 isoform 2-T3 [Leptodactylus fuscus]